MPDCINCNPFEYVNDENLLVNNLEPVWLIGGCVRIFQESSVTRYLYICSFLKYYTLVSGKDKPIRAEGNPIYVWNFWLEQKEILSFFETFRSLIFSVVFGQRQSVYSVFCTCMLTFSSSPNVRTNPVFLSLTLVKDKWTNSTKRNLCHFETSKRKKEGSQPRERDKGI